MCPKCGFANQAGYQFCSNCGNPLGAAPAPAAPTPYGVPPPTAAPAYGAPPYAAPPGYPTPYGYGPSPWEYERTKQVDRTKTGILLLLIGTLINWLPFIGLVGSLLILIGAILVILGRKAFGEGHTRNVLIAIILFFVGIVVAIAFGVASFLASLPATFGTNPMTPAEAAAFATALVNDILLSAIISGLIVGLASVLFTYALQRQTGKLLLWAAYGAGIVLNVAIFLYISPLIADAVAQAVAGGTYNAAPIDALTSQISSLQLLSAIPALLWTGANYLAWSRINRGEIPASGQAPSPAMPGMPPAPPMPPR